MPTVLPCERCRVKVSPEVLGCSPDEHRLPYGDERAGAERTFREIHNPPPTARCVECYARLGQRHHVGCTVEECATCRHGRAYCECSAAEAVAIIRELLGRIRLDSCPFCGGCYAAHALGCLGQRVERWTR